MSEKTKMKAVLEHKISGLNRIHELNGSIYCGREGFYFKYNGTEEPRHLKCDKNFRLEGVFTDCNQTVKQFLFDNQNSVYSIYNLNGEEEFSSKEGRLHSTANDVIIEHFNEPNRVLLRDISSYEFLASIDGVLTNIFLTESGFYGCLNFDQTKMFHFNPMNNFQPNLILDTSCICQTPTLIKRYIGRIKEYDFFYLKDNKIVGVNSQTKEVEYKMEEPTFYPESLTNKQSFNKYLRIDSYSKRLICLIGKYFAELNFVNDKVQYKVIDISKSLDKVMIDKENSGFSLRYPFNSEFYFFGNIHRHVHDNNIGVFNPERKECIFAFSTNLLEGLKEKNIPFPSIQFMSYIDKILYLGLTTNNMNFNSGISLYQIYIEQ
jgi:hypothetical protein